MLGRRNPSFPVFIRLVDRDRRDRVPSGTRRALSAVSGTGNSAPHKNTEAEGSLISSRSIRYVCSV